MRGEKSWGECSKKVESALSSETLKFGWKNAKSNCVVFIYMKNSLLLSFSFLINKKKNEHTGSVSR